MSHPELSSGLRAPQGREEFETSETASTNNSDIASGTTHRHETQTLTRQRMTVTVRSADDGVLLSVFGGGQRSAFRFSDDTTSAGRVETAQPHADCSRKTRRAETPSRSRQRRPSASVLWRYRSHRRLNQASTAGTSSHAGRISSGLGRDHIRRLRRECQGWRRHHQGRLSGRAWNARPDTGAPLARGRPWSGLFGRGSGRPTSPEGAGKNRASTVVRHQRQPSATGTRRTTHRSASELACDGSRGRRRAPEAVAHVRSHSSDEVAS